MWRWQKGSKSCAGDRRRARHRLGIALRLAQDGFAWRSRGGERREDAQAGLECDREHGSDAIYVQADVADGCGAGAAAAGDRRAVWQARCAGEQRGHRAAGARRHPGSARRTLRRGDGDESQGTVFPDAGRGGVDDPAAGKRSARRIARSSTLVRSRQRWPA